jgi:hypothetical protein
MNKIQENNELITGSFSDIVSLKTNTELMVSIIVFI